MEIRAEYGIALGLLKPLGLLEKESPESLRKKVEGLDGEDEFLDWWENNRPEALSTLVAHLDPNALPNPGERAKGVALWNPPLLAPLGLHGVYDSARRRVRIESEGRVLSDQPVTHSCHAAVAWNKALAGRGFEILLLYLGTDDESFVAVTQAAAARIRSEEILSYLPPCPQLEK